MTFSSSPSLEDGSGSMVNPGVSIGGGSRDSIKEQQIYAMKKAQQEELCRQREEQERLIQQEQQERMTLQQLADEKIRKRQEAQQKAASHAYSFITFVVIGILLYMVYDATRFKRNTY